MDERKKIVDATDKLLKLEASKPNAKQVMLNNKKCKWHYYACFTDKTEYSCVV